MRIKANGKEEEIEQNFSVLEFLGKKGIRPETVAVELNGTVLAKDEYARTRLGRGDALEIVKFVGGG